jgi:hypothetical protein
MNAKKISVIAGAAVLIYSVIVYPVQLASGVQAVVGWLTTGVESAITFARTVFT